MSKWKQVGGDHDFSGNGCTLAKVNKGARQVELVRITPWLELDSSALKEGYGFWDVSTKTLDYEDMGVNREDVRSAIKTSGLDADEYKKLGPEDKAVVIADHKGYEDSTSTNDFAEALPCPIEDVEFYAGKHAASQVPEINASMRREVVNKLYGGRYGKKVPGLDALELALGDSPLELSLNEDEAQALRYALALDTEKFDFSKVRLQDKITVNDAEALHHLLSVLSALPRSDGLRPEVLEQLRRGYEAHYDLNWEDKDEQVKSMIDDDVDNARELSRTILGDLGF